MTKIQSPVLGFNNNVRYKNRVFHVQTEDSGVNHPHIITHLFMDGGRILKSVKQSYAEHVGAEGMRDIVRNLMKEQHKAVFTSLRGGEFDELLANATKGGLSSGSAAPPSTTIPASGIPISSIPLSGLPPMSGLPASASPMSGLPVSALPQSRSPATVEPATQPTGIPSFESSHPSAEAKREPAMDTAPAVPSSKRARTKTLAPPAVSLDQDPATVRLPHSPSRRDVPDSLREIWTREPSSRPPEAIPSSHTPFHKTERPPPASLFSEDLVSDKSLDEVILSFLSEDLG